MSKRECGEKNISYVSEKYIVAYKSKREHKLTHAGHGKHEGGTSIKHEKKKLDDGREKCAHHMSSLETRIPRHQTARTYDMNNIHQPRTYVSAKSPNIPDCPTINDVMATMKCAPTTVLG